MLAEEWLGMSSTSKVDCKCNFHSGWTSWVFSASIKCLDFGLWIATSQGTVSCSLSLRSEQAKAKSRERFTKWCLDLQEWTWLTTQQ